MSSIMKPTSNTDFSRKVTVEHFYHWGSASAFSFQGDHIELMFRQHHQDISFADQHWERVDSFQFGVDYVNCEQGTDSGYCLCYCLHGRCMSECTVIVSKLPVLTITIQVMRERWAGQESVTDGAQEEESRMQVECCGTLKNEGWWIICWPSSQED